MMYRIVHVTGYAYSEPASLSHNELLVTPRSEAGQLVSDRQLRIEPEPQYLQERVDYFGNITQVFMVQQPHRELTVTATSTVQTAAGLLPEPMATRPWELVAAELAAPSQAESLFASQYRYASPLVALLPAARQYAAVSFSPGRPILVAAFDLLARLHRDFTYDKAATAVDTPVAEVLRRRRGVCQDFAHVAISCLRGLGLAARYVSGYLETLPPPGKAKLVGADASHAWLSLYLPDWGWCDLDPTNNMPGSERHITVAWGRDYGDVTPVKGVVLGGGRHSLTVSVDVTALPPDSFDNQPAITPAASPARSL